LLFGAELRLLACLEILLFLSGIAIINVISPLTDFEPFPTADFVQGWSSPLVQLLETA
jgi:hypothetical protein